MTEQQINLAYIALIVSIAIVATLLVMIYELYRKLRLEMIIRKQEFGRVFDSLNNKSNIATISLFDEITSKHTKQIFTLEQLYDGLKPKEIKYEPLTITDKNLYTAQPNNTLTITGSLGSNHINKAKITKPKLPKIKPKKVNNGKRGTKK